jgi:hypothetical protein
MQVVAARWAVRRGFPILAIEFEGGREAAVTHDALKPAVLDQDVVMLSPLELSADHTGSAWLDHLPAVMLNRDDGSTFRVDGGFVKDAAVAKLAREYLAALDAGKFTPRTLTLSSR